MCSKRASHALLWAPHILAHFVVPLLCHLQAGLAAVKANLNNLDRVAALSEALPYLQKFRGKTIVIKYGGAAMKDPSLKVCCAGHKLLVQAAHVQSAWFSIDGQETHALAPDGRSPAYS